MTVFCSLACNREYHRIVVAYPGDGTETECPNCGAPIIPNNPTSNPQRSTQMRTQQDYAYEQVAHSTCRIGDWAEEDGLYRLVISARLERMPGVFTTVTHGHVTDPLRLAIVGDINRRARNGRWVEAGGGQCVDAVPRVTAFAAAGEPGAGLGWTERRAGRLHRLWTDWHLNDMNPACIHMGDNARCRWDAGEPVTCPTTGYSFGSAWLVRPLPQRILDELTNLFGWDPEAMA